MSYPQSIHKLSIVMHLDEICAQLKSSKSRFLVLTAETGAGKSTALPIALFKHFAGKILMTEPRRLSAVAVSTRVSEIIGEEVGETVGYTLHMESKKSARTRLEVLTEAILTRRLQSDPLLEGVDVVVLDEFHERSVNMDLALAFLKQAMELRDDLYVVIMSATIDYRSLADFLDAETMHIQGRLFPVEKEYRVENVDNCVLSLLTNNQSLGYPQSIHKNVDNLWTNVHNFENSSKVQADTCRKDTILVFLPGIREIQKAKEAIESKLGGTEAEILILHSSIPLSEQKKILSEVPISEPRRVILSSAIAETSLTVPGVSTVVDSGFCRLNRMDVSLGMERLVTERESIFSAEQRAGRAGRTMAGKCIRLWSRSDTLRDSTPPEILRTDLAQLVLECAKWGAREPESLEWLTPPPSSAWQAARSLLLELGLLDKDGKITEKGEDALTLGLTPRLACVALSAENSIGTVVLFSEYRDAPPQRQRAFEEDLRRRLSRTECRGTGKRERKRTEEILLSGFPDRIARKVESKGDFTTYQFPSGRKASIKLTNGSEWIVAPKVDAGETTGKIYEYENLDTSFAEKWIQDRAAIETLTTLDCDMRMRKAEITHYGKIVIKEKKLSATADDFSDAVCQTLKEKGLHWLPIGKAGEEFLLRAKFYAKNKPDSSLSKKIESLAENADEWLKPFLTSTKLNEKTVLDALRYHLDGGRIDSEAPTEIKLPNGRKRKIVYERIASSNEGGEERIRPVLEIIIQQIFGCFETPKLLGVPVLLKLLSPARRPLQITEDLEHFWSGAWIEICKEMKGRYPKHNWDYRIADDSD